MSAMAWVENDKIRDICRLDPNQCYTADVAAYYDTVVPDDAQNGYVKYEDAWVDPSTIVSEPV